ncbi:MFS transporter [Streptomyces sp. NPDC017524]|uniref:MFS transporter n=1 Tax=unclassified Streptomyces TaxID=2593676 RepID=UPI00379D08F5
MPISARHRWWALGALSLSMLAVGLDGTVLNVALPALAESLDASGSELQWFSSSYLVFLAAAMLPAGLVGDRYGRRKTLVCALLLFGAASVACAWAQTPWQFITARCLLGVAGAGIIVMALSALTVLFSEDERPKAVGIWSAANFLALPLGPLAGGWLLTHFWWGWVFLINVPVTLIGLGAVLAFVPETLDRESPRMDPLGMVLSVGGLVAVTYGLIRAGEFGWGEGVAWALMIGGLLVLFAFYRHQVRLTARPGGHPMLDPRLFRARAYTWGVILIGFVALANIGVLFLMPQFFQAVQGTDALGSGLRLLPMIGGLVLGAVPAGRIVQLLGTKVAIAAGFAVMAAGLLLGAKTDASSPLWFVGVWMAMSGFGMGLAMASATSAVLSQVPEERSGVGAAVLQAVNKVGAPFGAAVLGSVALTAYQSHLTLPTALDASADEARSGIFGGIAVAERVDSASLLSLVRDSFTHGLHIALVVSAGFALVGLALTLLFMPGSPGRRPGADGSGTQNAPTEPAGAPAKGLAEGV